MATYHNDFNKKKDPMMWELHEIRNDIKQEKLTSVQINKNADKILAAYRKKDKKTKSVISN